MTAVTPFGAGSALWGRRRFLWLLSLALVRPAKAASVTVEIRQFKFDPAEIEASAGTTVTFVNLDVVPHTATGDSFDTGALKKDERREIAFDASGEYRYLCRFHRHMKGIIRVK